MITCKSTTEPHYEKELSLYHKLNLSLYMCNQTALTFNISNLNWSNRIHILKYLSSKTLDCKDTRIRNQNSWQRLNSFKINFKNLLFFFLTLLLNCTVSIKSCGITWMNIIKTNLSSMYNLLVKRRGKDAFRDSCRKSPDPWGQLPARMDLMGTGKTICRTIPKKN